MHSCSRPKQQRHSRQMLSRARQRQRRARQMASRQRMQSRQTLMRSRRMHRARTQIRCLRKSRSGRTA